VALAAAAAGAYIQKDAWFHASLLSTELGMAFRQIPVLRIAKRGLYATQRSTIRVHPD
jgi:hypothetical protein